MQRDYIYNNVCNVYILNDFLSVIVIFVKSYV